MISNHHCHNRHYINTALSNFDNIFFVKNDVEILKILLKLSDSLFFQNEKRNAAIYFLPILCYRININIYQNLS